MRVFMSDGNPQNGSVWPVVTVIAGLFALGALGWDVMLQGRMKKMEERLVQVERARSAAAAPIAAKAAPKPAMTDAPAGSASSRRRKGATTRPATTQAATQPAAKSGDSVK
jgi:hypothetical protein